MQSESPSRSHLLLLFFASLIPRIVGAIWLPNAFGDAYAYTEQIYHQRRALVNGSFTISNLFGFWLPLYQFVCACLSALFGNPFYVSKLVSAFCGAGLCVTVCLLTWELTKNRSLSLATAAIVALNPYHLFFSSSAMTDVPYAFSILLCAYCCIKDRWLLATVVGIAAGLIRVESWTMIPLIPLVQFLKQPQQLAAPNFRRSALGWRLFKPLMLGLLLAAGPIFWLYVSWKATGSATKYFEIRNDYIVETLAANPWLAQHSLARTAFDLVRLIYTSNPVTIVAALALLVIILRRTFSVPFSRRSVFPMTLSYLRTLLTSSEGFVVIVFSSHLAFLLLAYITNNQPEIWPRYGLTFFTLGLPLIAVCWLSIQTKLHFAGRFSGAFPLYRSAVIVLILFVLQFCIQLIDVTRMTVAHDPNRIAAEFLEDQRKIDNSTTIYCEDGAIRVLSGIPLEEFKDQYNSPTNDDAFLQSLKDNDVRLLVYKDLPGSRLKQLIARLRTGKHLNGLTLEELKLSPRRKPKESLVVYRIHADEIAKVSRRRR